MSGSGLDVVQDELPVNEVPVTLTGDVRTGLVLVDIVNGFCTVGAGLMAPTAPDKQISRMVDESVQLAKIFCDKKWPVFAFLDTHHPDIPEPPYPPHCIEGTDEANFHWYGWKTSQMQHYDVKTVSTDILVPLRRMDPMSLQIGWKNTRLKLYWLLGYATDICVLDFVCSALSARNRGHLKPLKDVIVYSDGCATFDLPKEVANATPGALAHPQDIMHHVGLYMALGRGAQVASEVLFAASK
ncbi:hypothetical protein R6Q59_008034 [Mikania micrantha]